MTLKHLGLDSNPHTLVTGGAGFIGFNICEAFLQNGNTVRCLDNFSTGKKENIAHLSNHPKIHFGQR